MTTEQIAKKLLEIADFLKSQNDPYAELKAAHKAGKPIQVFRINGLHESQQSWEDCSNPDWRSGLNYRIKPDYSFPIPPSPPNMKWHEMHSWNAYDTPTGYRLLVEDEVIQEEDEYYNNGWHKVSADMIYGIGKKIQCGATAFRTRRPLTFTHAGKTWTWHRPDDPMPCDVDALIWALYDNGSTSLRSYCASDCTWGSIIGWRYADEKKTVPLGPEDVRCGDEVLSRATKERRCITCVFEDGILLAGEGFLSFTKLKEREIRRRDSDVWQPCHKPA